jgi:hypothetical protein
VDWLLRWTIACLVLAPLQQKSTIKSWGDLKENIRFLAITAVLESHI